MAQPEASPAVPASPPPSPQQQLRQPLKLVGCRAPLCDVAVCLATAAVAGVDVVLANSLLSGAAHGFAAGTAPPAGLRGGREAPTGAASSPTTLSGTAADGDACVLLTPEGSIHSAYAICLYFTSQAATEQARETLLPSSACLTQGQEQRQQGCGDATKIRPATKRLWLVEDWLAWAAFSLRAAVRGVRKDVLLRQLDLLDQHIGSSPAFAGLTLPAMFVYSALRYSFPTSTFSDWPAVSKWLTAISSSPVFAAVSRLAPPPVFAQYPQAIRRAGLLACPTSQHSCGQDARVQGEGNATGGVQREGHTDAQPLAGGDTHASLPSARGGATEVEHNVSEKPRGAREKFYLTTAINYTNGPPHMGHVYEAVAADVIARYHRVFGRDVYFLTGTDEHGQKIANTAARLGKQPQDICDMYVAQFQNLNQQLSISNDFYIRTTMPAHKKVCQWLWERVKANGDIYLDTYRGWYNEREETFVSEQDARAADYKDAVTGKPLLQMEESSYFFRMSKYQARLVEHIKQNPRFILPEERRRHILKRLEEPLHDLSCSRNTFSWGVPVPDDAAHVMYVWFDALTNYISALGAPDGEKYKRYWPANLHLIGKDILWFHTVIWPCMLMSASVPLPQSVFGHGFVLAADGEKMSKSLGNVVNPLDILKDYDSDSFRFYLMRAGRFGCDLRFETEGLAACINADLADTLGNLVHRALSLCVKFCDGRVPPVPLPGATGLPPFSIPAVFAEVEECMKQLMLREASEVAMEACRSANKYLTDWAPWNLSNPVEKQQVVRGALEAVYVLAHLLEPFIPVAAAQIFEKLNTERRTLTQLSPWFDNLTPGTRVHVGDVLFTKKVAKSAEIAFQKCEVRVGRVVKAQPHPQFSKDPSFPPYMVLTVSFSPDKTGADSQQKTAVVLLDREVRENPGLVLNRRVLAVCNVKPVSVKGVMSQVMVLAGAKNETKPGDATAEAELLRVAGEVDEDGGDLQKREDSHTREVAKATDNACDQLGALVEAAGYPPVLKNREHVRTAEMQAMDFIVQKDKSILLNGKFALRIGQGGAAVCCGRQTPTGKLVLV